MFGLHNLIWLRPAQSKPIPFTNALQRQLPLLQRPILAVISVSPERREREREIYNILRSDAQMKPKSLINKPTPSPVSAAPAPPTPEISYKTSKWVPLNLPQSELSLPLTFPTGQTFRWKQTAPLHFTGALGPHLVSLRHTPPNGDVFYLLHSASASADADAEHALRDFLNASVPLRRIWAAFSAADPRFAELSARLGGGARVLRQDPLECLLQFLCSSNNNIARITKMVGFVSSLGTHLGTVAGFEFHEFPSLDRLSEVSEQELRDAGFGYRAKYITGTVKALRAKPGGGEEWLRSLRNLELEEVIEELCTLPGVGPKVAACIALFSLDQHHAIPVDTHVWQIATRHLLPELAGARLTQKLCSRVAEAFVDKYGKYAGWAQTLLFIAELPSQKAVLLPSLLSDAKEKKKSAKRKIIVAYTDADTVTEDC